MLASPSPSALHLERWASELQQTLSESAGSLTVDDALFYFETRRPELLEDLPLLFSWLALFLTQHETDTSPNIAAGAVQNLDNGKDAATLADDLQLKSSLTLLFWKYEAERQHSKTGQEGQRTSFQNEKELLQWLRNHRDVLITRQDVTDHVVEQYPAFADSKSPAALKVWVLRFLQKHVPPYTESASTWDIGDATAVKGLAIGPQETPLSPAKPTAESSTAPPTLPSKSDEACSSPKRAASSPRKQCSTHRRTFPDGYMLYSNETKLRALQQLDAGKSVAEVAAELGLKSSKRLTYWKSVRDKLTTSEKKRFRLAGGGRRSSCSFEAELLTWVSERHQQGEATDVKAVLEYMKELHPSFTAGKKEATLRKWILRFFKRCWRAPSTSMDSQDAEKSYIFTCDSTMETADTRPDGIPARVRQTRARSRPNGSAMSPADVSQTSMNSAILLNRLHKTRQSIPARKEAKVYSSAQRSPGGLNGMATTKQILGPANAPVRVPVTTTTPKAKLSPPITASLIDFEKKYAADDPLMRYVLYVIRTGSSVLRSEIPRGKHTQRKVRPEDDVLYLMHCQAPPCGFCNVYWLEFVDESAVLHDGSLDYFTLGSLGITRFKGGQGVEFSDLTSWVDEKRAFDQMTKMKGLDRIQQMVFFFSWKRRAVQRRWHRVQERLACSLFTCHPIAAKLLMRARDICAIIENEAQRDILDPCTSYALEQYANLRYKRLREAKAIITRNIHALCDEINTQTENIASSHGGEGSSYAVTDHGIFSKALRRTSLRERMFTFLRLVDFHVSEAVYQHLGLVVDGVHAQICGPTSPVLSRTGEAAAAGEPHFTAEQSIAYLALSERPAESGIPDQACRPITYCARSGGIVSLAAPFPAVYTQIEENVDFEGDVNSTAMEVIPSKTEILALVHAILVKYCVDMDDLPRVVSDARFEYVLTPFVPSVRRRFISKSMLKPSHLVLESHQSDLNQMRAALESYFRYIRVLQQEHLRCVRAIKVAERESQSDLSRKVAAVELDDHQVIEDESDARIPDLLDLSTSAAAYELAKKTWHRFAQYANTAAPVLQVGCLLLDQRSFISKLRLHVAKRVAEMDDALPSIYKQVLSSLLEDVDGKIEKVTKIPSNLAEANAWLVQVTSMMPTHLFRQQLDAKRANLVRLKTMVKERDVSIEDCIRTLELTWESTIETLLLCLTRVEDRGSEHRRSVQDAIAKADDYITGEMKLLLKMFEELPTGCEQDTDDKVVLGNSSVEDDIVQRLEDLVVMDLERNSVVQQFESYDREHRVLMELPPFQQEASIANANMRKESTGNADEKLPSELLLQYVITSLELRHWFETWTKLQDKWVNSPVTGVHPGTLVNRIKQYRRRLGHASSKLSRLASTLVQVLSFEPERPTKHGLYSETIEEGRQQGHALFVMKDFELIRLFDSNIEDILNCNRVFQAVNGGAFSEARWGAMHQLLGAEVLSGPNQLTLRRMKESCSKDQVEAFMGACDECIVEAKLHMKMEQASQRLARIEIQVEETNYSVRCSGMEEALSQLDDIAVELKLCLFGQNPELQLCLELSGDVERKVGLCEHILEYQKYWHLRCEATKLHELDEFFSKSFGGGEYGYHRQKPSLKQDQSVWQAFLDASHAWNDRLRRLFFVAPRQTETNTKSNQPVVLGKKKAAGLASTNTHPRVSTGTKSITCSLGDVAACFAEFDFDTNFAVCERGDKLIQSYLDTLRETSPRLYCLDDMMLLKLLLRDSDVSQLHQALGVLFPRVHRFEISRVVNRIGSVPSALSAPVRANDTNTTIIISGLEDIRLDVDRTANKCGCFRLPVAKIGRVKFWFTRLEEELGFMVQTDMRRGLEWVTNDWNSPGFAEYKHLLPQSISTGYNFRFTIDMDRALCSDMRHQLYELQTQISERTGGILASFRSGKMSCVRLENILLLNNLQSEITHNMVKLFKQSRNEEAIFFWSLQFQIRAFVEALPTSSSTGQPSVGGGRADRYQLFPTNSDFVKEALSNHSDGQSPTLAVSCQVAHLQLPLGQEFVGVERLAIVSPFTQRCCYALFSALKMCHTALVVPYYGQETAKDPSSLVWAIGQMLMRQCIEFSCSPSAGVITLTHLSNLMQATSRTSGFLIVRHLLQLSLEFVAVVRERMLDHLHRHGIIGSPTSSQQQVAANSLIRQPGGTLAISSAIFIPLNSGKHLRRSGLLHSVRSHFRAVEIIRPAVKYMVECLLITSGFTPAQIQELNVALVFEALAAIDFDDRAYFSAELESLIPHVINEAKRLREAYAVKWDLHTASGQSSRNTNPFWKLNGGEYNSVDMEMREYQCFFRQAFTAALPLLTTQQNNGVAASHIELLMAKYFPFAESGRLVTKNRSSEEAVSAAVSIYLETAFSASKCEQFELVMQLWRALQSFPAVLVYGSIGCGKTTCITTLHRALTALELSELNRENEEEGSQVKPTAALTRLTILNPDLLTLDEFYTNVKAAVSTECGANLLWVLVDGEIDGAVLERLLAGDNRANPYASSLPSNGVFHRSHYGSIMSPSSSSAESRLVLEAINMSTLSPLALCSCWALHISERCITIASIIRTWRARWSKQVSFEEDLRGTEAMALVFRVVDILILRICIQFVADQTTHGHDEATIEALASGTLQLGWLSLNHIIPSALTLVAQCCFQHKALLLNQPFSRLVELSAFAVLWGFTGHLTEQTKQNMEHYVRAKCKQFSETRHLSELPCSLLDTNFFEDVWDVLQPKLASSLSLQAISAANIGGQSNTHFRKGFDPFNGQVLVLAPAATSLIRICMLFVHSAQSFILIGPAAAGKTSLLRWIIQQNLTDEAAEMKVEISIDERHVHGILDWTRMPAAWFRPLGDRVCSKGSRARLREEAELFGGRAKYSFVFLDDLNAGASQVQFVRTMLDHRLGASLKHKGFQALDKQVGAAMRLDDFGPRSTKVSRSLERLLRHFIVLRVPTYAPKELQSIFRVKYQDYFKVSDTQASGDRKFSFKADGSGTLQVSQEEIILRGSIDFAVEVLALQQLGHTKHPSLFAFNVHHLNLLLERTLAFAANSFRSNTSDDTSASEGTTLVMLGKAHQGWISELGNIFLSSFSAETSPGGKGYACGSQDKQELSDDGGAQQKINDSLRCLSEKYFSVALRGSSDQAGAVSVEALYFVIELAEHHAQAPLLQPRLIQLREHLNEQMTTGNGGSRRSSNYSGTRSGSASGITPGSSPMDLVTSMLLDMTATHSSTHSAYSNREALDDLEMKLLLSSSWCLTQTLHLVHALRQQQQIVVSAPSHQGRGIAERLLRFSCDLHGFKIHVINDQCASEGMTSDENRRVLHLVLGAAAVRQERVALWIHQRQLRDSSAKELIDVLYDLSSQKLPSFSLLPGGEELRNEVMLSCINSRNELEVISEVTLWTEFQQRLQYNFRICLLEEVDEDVGQNDSEAQGTRTDVLVVAWMKTRPSCHWRRLNFTKTELQKALSEMAKTTIESPGLCNAGWGAQFTAKFVGLCENLHSQAMDVFTTSVDPVSQLCYFLSFLVNVVAAYNSKLESRSKNIARLQCSLETLTFTRDKVIPALEHLKESFTVQHDQIERGSIQPPEIIGELKDEEETSDELAEAAWITRSRHEELSMLTCEIDLRLEQLSRYFTLWHSVADRIKEHFGKWTCDLEGDRQHGTHYLLCVAASLGVQRTYARLTELTEGKLVALHGDLEKMVYDAIHPNGFVGMEGEDRFAENENNELVQSIWASQCPLLHSEHLYRTIQCADELCDRIPVIVDTSGVLQRFFVHFFSGHTLFSSLPGCNTSSEFENESSCVTKDAMVISCDDPSFESQLQQAQRLAVPVLLINFRSADSLLMRRLLPFVGASRLPYAPLRRPVLRELTLKCYEDQRKQKQRRPTTLGSAVTAASSAAQSTRAASSGAISTARRAVRERLGSKYKAALDVVSAAITAHEALSHSTNIAEKTSDRRDTRTRRPVTTGNKSTAFGFQLFVVTTTPVKAEIQHSLAAQFAFFTGALLEANLEEVFRQSLAEKNQPTLYQEIHVAHAGLADCWMKKNQHRYELLQVLKDLKPDMTEVDGSPFASQKAHATSELLSVQEQERFITLATQLSRDHQAEIDWLARRKELLAKQAEFKEKTEHHYAAAIRLAGIAHSMTATSSLVLGERISPFYLRSGRYVEVVANQNPGAPNDEKLLSIDSITASLMQRVSAGFVLNSHRQIFWLFQTFQNHFHTERLQANAVTESSLLAEAVTWLVCGRIRENLSILASGADLNHSGSVRDFLGPVDFPGRRDSRPTSLVERLRRRVKLCAYLFNGWRPSQRGKRLPRNAKVALGSNVLSSGKGVKTGTSDPSTEARKEVMITQLQEMVDGLLSASETLWYEWKATKTHLQSDVQQLLKDARSVEIAPSTESTARELVTLDDMVSGFKITRSFTSSEVNPRTASVAPLLLAKAFFPADFATAISIYINQEACAHTTLITSDPVETKIQVCTSPWKYPPPAALVADISPARGKNSRAHMPRALIFYTPDQRNSLALTLAGVDVAIYVNTKAQGTALREELVMLVTSRRRFVVEILDSKHAELALALISHLINEHALLAIPEWYLLASFTVAVAVESGKFTVMDRIAASNQQLLFDLFNRDSTSVEHRVKRKLVEDCGISNQEAGALISTTLQQDKGQVSSCDSLVVRDLEDLVAHCLAIGDTASGDHCSSGKMLQHLQLLSGITENKDQNHTWNEETNTSKLSSELLSDLLCAGSAFVQTRLDTENERTASHSISDGKNASAQLWASCNQISKLFESLVNINRLDENPRDGSVNTQFVPWQTFDEELMAQIASFAVFKDRINLLHDPLPSDLANKDTAVNQKQQQFASLARGYLSFDWIEVFFKNIAWPSQSSGTVAIAQMQLLIACRIGVLARCIRGDRAWALNLAVVSDACSFLRKLQIFTANQNNAPQSAFELVIDLDADVDESDKSKKTAVVAKQFVSIIGDDIESDWHGAVLHLINKDTRSWGVRVDGLVLVEQSESPPRTKLHPLALCRIMCQLHRGNSQVDQVPVILLPSLSVYQSPPVLHHPSPTTRVVLGTSILSTIGVNASASMFAIGVPIFPDDDGHDAS